MPNEFDRLRAANPATDDSYNHGSLEAVASRAMRPSVSGAAKFAQGFRVKMASAAMAAALLTSAGIVAIESSSPSLPVLALGGTSAAATSDVAQSPTNKLASPGAMMIWGTYQYKAASSLSDAPGIAPVYKVSGPASSEATVIALAKALGIYSSTIAVTSDSQIAPIASSRTTNYSYSTDKGIVAITASEDGPTTWYFNVPAEPAVSGDSSESVSNADLARWSSALIDSLSFGMTLSDPTFNSWGASGSATYQVVVDGLTTDLSISLTFDANGSLQWANGTIATFDRVGNYPLISEHDGVANLGNGSAPYSTHGGPVMMYDTPAGSGVAPASGDESTAPGADVTTTTEVPTPPTITVLLTDAKIQLSLQTLADGSSWLIPMYVYEGTSTYEGGASNPGTWSTIAVDPKYLEITPTSGWMGTTPLLR